QHPVSRSCSRNLCGSQKYSKPTGWRYDSTPDTRLCPLMKLSLIISTYDQPTVLAKVLRGVSRQTRLPDEVFIADDGSGPRTRELIQQWKREVQFPVHHVWHPHDGFRKVILLNRAAAAAKGEYLIFLDG